MNISTRRQHVKKAGRPSQSQDTDTESMNGHALLHRLRSANYNRDHRIIKRPLPGIKTLTKIHSAKERFILGKVGSWIVDAMKTYDSSLIILGDVVLYVWLKKRGRCGGHANIHRYLRMTSQDLVKVIASVEIEKKDSEKHNK